MINCSSMLYSIALIISLVAALVSAIGGVVYFAWNLAFPAMAIVLALALSAAAVIFKLLFAKREKISTAGPIEAKVIDAAVAKSKLWSLGLIPVFGLAAVCLVLLIRNQTDAAINTPWKQVPQLFWVSLAAASAAGAALLLRARAQVSFLVGLALLGVGATVAAIIFKIGYGYDPFIHTAAEQHILNFGLIAPKTIYYAGQYALVTIISSFTRLPIRLVDIWLLPVLAPLSIAGTICYAAKKKAMSVGPVMAGLLMILPLGAFIDTTPFGLAALYCLLSAITGLAANDDKNMKIITWIFAAAALLTHPIAGVPAIILAGCVQIKRPVWTALYAAGGALVLPILFSFAGKGFSFSLARIRTINLPFDLPLTRFHALGDPVYALGAAVVIIVAIGVLWNRLYLIAAASAILSGVLVAASIDFSYLPDSEQGGYAARLITIAILIAVPAAAFAIGTLLEKISGKGWYALAGIAAVVLFFVGGVYLAYPREDAYVISEGWNTSATDLAAVGAIADDAKDEPYIVLAAQPVSAAALSKFGFFKYYASSEGPIFAYPVPTGGPLYQYFLKMIYTDPSSEYMNQAMALAGVKRGYFVVNSYWTGADHAIARAKTSAESWFGINNADFVFRYQR